MIHLPGGRRFAIKAKGFSEDNKYITGARLNGQVLDRSWFTHEELMSGGVLELEMSGCPNPDWGRRQLPVSRLD